MQDPLYMIVMEVNVCALTTVPSPVNLTSFCCRVFGKVCSILHKHVKYDIMEEKQLKGFRLQVTVFGYVHGNSRRENKPLF